MLVNCYICGADVSIQGEPRYIFDTKVLCDECESKYGKPSEEDGIGIIINPVGHQYRYDFLLEKMKYLNKIATELFEEE